MRYRKKRVKKTIACEHITKALEQLGFSEYVPDILEVANEHKEQLKVRPALLLAACHFVSMLISF